MTSKVALLLEDEVLVALDITSTLHQRAKNHRYPAPTIAKHASADEPNAHGLTVDRLTRTAGITTPTASAANGHRQTTYVNPHTTSAMLAKIETKPSVEPIIVGLTTYVPRDETAAMRACSRPARSAITNAATTTIVPRAICTRPGTIVHRVTHYGFDFSALLTVVLA